VSPPKRKWGRHGYLTPTRVRPLCALYKALACSTQVRVAEAYKVLERAIALSEAANREGSPLLRYSLKKVTSDLLDQAGSLIDLTGILIDPDAPSRAYAGLGYA
jgi:hypothetical protein